MKAINPNLLTNFYKRICNIFAKKGDVGDGTITINQNGLKKGSFSTNQTGDTTIELSGETILTGTLKAGETSLTLTSEAISEDSLIDAYTNIYGVAPTAISQSAGSITLTFKSQSSDMGVKVVIR